MENRSTSPSEGNTHARFDEGMQRHRLYALFMQAPAAICVLRGPDLVFELANRPYTRLVGADRPLEGRPLLEALPSLAPDLHSILQQVYTQGEQFVDQEFRVTLDWDDNGQLYEKYLNLVYEPLHNDQGEVDGILGFAYEVTDQVLARIEAEQRLAMLTAVINSIPDAVYIGDTTGITMCNDAALSMLGFTTQAELNQHIDILADLIQTRDVATGDPLPPEQQPFALALGGEPQIRDVLIQHIQSGEDRIVRCAAAPIRHQGQILGAVAVNTDITIRKQAEEARLAFERSLLDTQRWESLGVLAGGIAHDFNNLLTVILGNAESVLRDLPASGPFRTELDQIVHTTLRAAELTHQMLAYAGKDQHILEAVSLNTMIQEVSMIINAAIPKTTTLTLQLGSPLPLIEADKSQLRQVIMNLVMNAVEALPGGLGTVTVQTGYRPLAIHERTSVVLSYERPAGPVVVFSVSDTGSGMDVATQTRIFEPFFTTKFTGRGLGLAAVSGIVRTHKGALMISSAPGHGTTMTIAFPPSARLAQGPVPDTAQLPEIEQSFTILVVEDEPAVLQLVVQTLTRLGYQVLKAENGQAGISIFQAHAQQIGMVLLDLTMPDLQGNQVAAAIWQIEPQARIVVMSGYSAELVGEAFPEGTLAGFLPKPFTIRDLRRAVAQAAIGTQENTRGI